MSSCSCHSLKEPLESYAQMLARCKASTPETFRSLDKIRVDATLWLEIYQCRVCGTLFAGEFPFGESQGGGSRCLYRIETADVDKWLQSYVPLTPQTRRNHEDAEFMSSLGEEIGPEKYQHNACRKLHIQNSVMCRQHHFEMLRVRV